MLPRGRVASWRSARASLRPAERTPSALLALDEAIAQRFERGAGREFLIFGACVCSFGGSLLRHVTAGRAGASWVRP